MEKERNLVSSMTTYLMIDDCDSSSSPKKQKIDAPEFPYKQLFQKELTLSDVGKHNRLVIPKRYAAKYFPQVQDEEMIFYDTSRTPWKLRYCYIKKKFVKDNDLRTKDTIVFHLCEFKNGTKENCNIALLDFVIDVVKNIEELTPTDVGRNSRLVIPKKYEMIIYDTSRTLWKFKYRYCKRSRSFLFTRGWLNFVKDKGLRAKNTIIFNLCEFKNGTKVNNCNTFVIDVVKNIEVLPMDHQEEMIDQDAAAANLIPVYLFGKQIGWTGTIKGNGI
ncbi:hypothetical protein R3W88_031464 [Solanum pinnatisectum]|uniref:TF-B3 domain-containing protein n=1 Tax=Solanum pinnatisectum TaxID=50273 RepID=A0AAV9LLE5_9SOLN|nr:hypothetical protein R3W88_031464 [Solanum pinnatisectum]